MLASLFSIFKALQLQMLRNISEAEADKGQGCPYVKQRCQVPLWVLHFLHQSVLFRYYA